MLGFNKFPLIIAQLPGSVDGAVEEAAGAVAVAAQDRVAVESGDLRDAIHTEKQSTASYAVVAGDENVFYGHLVENGTTRTSPQPFLLPALEENEDTALRLVEDALEKL